MFRRSSSVFLNITSKSYRHGPSDTSSEKFLSQIAISKARASTKCSSGRNDYLNAGTESTLARLLFGSRSNRQQNSGSSGHSWRNYFLFAGVAEAVFLSTTTPVRDEEHRRELKEAMVLNIKKSILRMRDRDFRKAENFLHVALGIARQIGDPQAEVYILDLLANLYFEEKQYSKAEATFKEVLRRELTSGRPEDTESVIEISAKLAKIYADIGDVEKARAGFDFCLGKLENLLVDLHDERSEEIMDLYFKIVQWGSEFLVNLGDKSEKSVKDAVVMIEKSLEKAKDLQQTGAEAYQTLANNLSTLYTWQNRVEEAVDVMKETIKLAVASDHWSLGHFYLNLAHIYAEHGDIAGAESMIDKAADQATKTKDAELENEVENLRKDLKNRRSSDQK